MPCGGNNSGRRQQLLSELKSLVARMDQNEIGEWDEQAGPPRRNLRAIGQESPSYPIPLKASKSYEFRGSMMYRCECIKKNGLQDRCMFLDCMGRPECMTDVSPSCSPGRAALLKLSGLGDPQVGAYCRLVCSDQPPSNQPQSRNYGPRSNNDAQRIRSSPADAQQQQLYRPQMQRHQQQQQQNNPRHYYQDYYTDYYPTYYPSYYQDYYGTYYPTYYPQYGHYYYP